MKTILLLFSVFALSVSSLFAQQSTLTNDSIIKMSKAGLSDGIIVTTIDSSPNSFQTNPDDLVALKNDGVSEKVIAEMVKTKVAPPVNHALADYVPPPATDAPSGPPRVFLESSNSGSNWTGLLHNQTLELAKDFGRDCPSAVVTVNQDAADYILSLNHVESGFLYRDNQMQVSDRNGDVISEPGRSESIANGVKRACEAIMTDWSGKPRKRPSK